MTALRALDSANLNGGQKLAVKYFTVALALLGVQIIFGLLAAVQFVMPDFLFGVVDFSIKRMVHINALIVWLLFGFMGSVYWMLEEEAGAPTVGLKLGNIIFYPGYQAQLRVDFESRNTIYYFYSFFHEFVSPQNIGLFIKSCLQLNNCCDIFTVSCSI